MIRKLLISVTLCMTTPLAGVFAVNTFAAGRAARHHAAINLSIMVGGLSKQIYLPNELALKLGYFAQQGLNVTLIDEPTGTSSVDAVIADQAQAGSGAYSHTIELQALGRTLTNVVQLTIAPGEAEMVARREAGVIKSFKDLRGKKLGVTELGSGTHTLSKFLLIKNGVPADQATFVPVGAGDTFIAAIQHSSIDAGMTSEPTISRLLRGHLARVLVDMRVPRKTRAALGGNYPFIGLFMMSSYVHSHRPIVQKVVNAYVKTLKWIHTHTAAQIADKLPADYYAGNKSLYLSALKAQLPMYSPNGMMPKGGPQFVLRLSRETSDSVKNANIDLSKTYTNEFVIKAH